MTPTRVATLLVLAGILLNACTPLRPSDDVDGDATIPCDEKVSWEEAVRILRTGEVEAVIQTHRRVVGFTLKNGCGISTNEPVIDAIFEEVQKCGDPCKSILMITE